MPDQSLALRSLVPESEALAVGHTGGSHAEQETVKEESGPTSLIWCPSLMGSESPVTSHRQLEWEGAVEIMSSTFTFKGNRLREIIRLSKCLLSQDFPQGSRLSSCSQLPACFLTHDRCSTNVE